MDELENSLMVIIDAPLKGDGAFRERLANYVNGLISTDFQKLLYLLYKVDVSEKKLRQLLDQETEHDSGLVIADLIIERQAQKIESRKRYTPPPVDDAEERW
jgi:hypothetical protein